MGPQGFLQDGGDPLTQEVGLFTIEPLGRLDDWLTASAVSRNVQQGLAECAPIRYVLHQREKCTCILHQLISDSQRIVANFIRCDARHLDNFGLELPSHSLISVCH